MFKDVSVRLGSAVRRRVRLAVVATVASGLVLTGCSTSVATKKVGNCSPEYSIGQTGYGKVSVRQPRKGAAIAWGVYVDQKYKFGTQFVLTVYAGGTKIDSKNQGYEPHGSVNAQRATKYSGKILEITGTGKHGKDTLFFDSMCYIA